jgi:hypothetical protein
MPIVRKTIKKSIITVVVRRVKAVLKPSTHINDYITNAKGVGQSMGSPTNKWFPASARTIPLSAFNADVKALDDLQTALHTKPPTVTTAERNDAKVIVEADQIKLLADVQKVADANPKNAITIIKSAGFAVELAHGHSKNSGPKNSKTGSVVITAPEAGHHEWAQLDANGVTWNSLRATTGDKKTVTGLIVGSRITFRSAPIWPEKDGESPWTVYQPITIT